MADINISETVRRAGNKIPSTYELTLRELGQLHDISKKSSIIQALICAYRFGFVKGTRAKSKGKVSTL